MGLEYPAFVDRKAIQINSSVMGNKAFRYSLSIPFRRTDGRRALVVMMNPSKATENESDPTVNRVLTRLYSECEDVSTAVITNLYPLYETYSSQLENHHKHCEKNITEISKLLKISDFVLFGWGKPNRLTQSNLAAIGYHEKALEVVQLAIKNDSLAFKVGELRDNLYPKHLGRLSFKTKMSKLDLADLEIKIQAQIERNNKRLNKCT